MKLFGALVCAATLMCVTSSPLLDEPGDLRAATCRFTPSCDTTGEEKVPIPCEGFCQSYFFCKDGSYTMVTCNGRDNFDNNQRKCDSGFKNCDWWRKTTPDPNKPPSSPGGTESTTDFTSSTIPVTEIPTSPPTTEGPCHANANCDATGEEKKPIPCANFCNQYYQCTNGFFTIEKCDEGNFDNVNRICSRRFKHCDWYKEGGTSSTPSTQPSESPPTTSATNPTSAPTTTPAGALSSTPKKTSRANSVFDPTISLFFTMIIPLLTRYL